jgi:hypothetical protein
MFVTLFNVPLHLSTYVYSVRGQLKCDGTRAETRFLLSVKRTSRFKSAGSSVQSTIGSQVVRISGSNAGYTMFRGSVKGTGYPLNSPVSPSLSLLCVSVCHHISTGVYLWVWRRAASGWGLWLLFTVTPWIGQEPIFPLLCLHRSKNAGVYAFSEWDKKQRPQCSWS